MQQEHSSRSALCSAPLTGAIPGCVTAQSCCSHCWGCDPVLVTWPGKPLTLGEAPSSLLALPLSALVSAEEGLSSPVRVLSTQWHFTLLQFGLEGTLEPSPSRDISQQTRLSFAVFLAGGALCWCLLSQGQEMWCCPFHGYPVNSFLTSTSQLHHQ